MNFYSIACQAHCSICFKFDVYHDVIVIISMIPLNSMLGKASFLHCDVSVVTLVPQIRIFPSKRRESISATR